MLRNLLVIRKSEAGHPRTRVASSSSGSSGGVTSSQENDDERDFEEFQLAEEKKYPFTFKHMIHKLYKKDDWLRTVKEVLEKSKKDFKPLAEYDMKQNPSESVDPHVPPNAKRGSATVGGREPWKMNLTGRRASLEPFPPNFSLIVINEPPAGRESLRALKKRCVGIRKSISGRPGGDGEQDFSKETKKSGNRATFVFASTTSWTSTESPGTEIYLHFPSPQVSPSDSSFSDAGQDITAPHSPVPPIISTSPSSLCTAGLKRRVGMNHQRVMLKAAPPNRLTERNLSKLSQRFSER